jgi:hypothetical protein
MTENNELNLDDVSVTEQNDEGLTDLQIYGLNSTIVRLLSKLRKYIVLTQLQMDLVEKPHTVQPIMREMYQFEETKMIMDIREEFDMFRVYTSDKIIIKNVNSLREKFEQAISFVTTNMQNVGSVFDKDYTEILDAFADKLQQINIKITSKSILSENFIV